MNNIMFWVHTDTAGPPITLFCLSLFHYNIDEKKIKSVLGLGYYVWNLQISHVHVGFLWALQFPPTSQRCAHSVDWCI